MKKRDRVIIYSAVVLLLLVILSSPIIVNKIIIHETSREIAKSSPWISFFGSIVSGIITGLITIIGVWATIRYYMNKDKKEERLKHLPYLRIQHSSAGADFESEASMLKIVEGTIGNLDVLTGGLINIGLGTAIGIKYYKLCGNTQPRMEDEINLRIDEKASFYIRYRNGNDNDNTKKEFVIEFSDMVGNTYHQKFEFDYSGNVIQKIKSSPPEWIDGK